MRELETKQASLDTLAVTIQALHVSGKQMTLAVFRQLPVTSAYQEDGSLSPLEHWGLVRYSIKDEGDLWLVASFDGRLYRCDVGSPRWGGLARLAADALDAFKAAEGTARRFAAWEADYKAFESKRDAYFKADEERDKLRPDRLAKGSWAGNRWDEEHPIGPFPTEPHREDNWRMGEGDEHKKRATQYAKRAQAAKRRAESQSTMMLLTQLFIAV